MIRCPVCKSEQVHLVGAANGIYPPSFRCYSHGEHTFIAETPEAYERSSASLSLSASNARASASEEADTIPAPPPEPTEPLNDKPEHPFHAHLDSCEQCRNHPFDLCDDGSELLGSSAVLTLTIGPHEPEAPPVAEWGVL